MDKTETLHTLSANKFEALYGKTPTSLIFAPGRINLIGEHTDYSDGFVLPVAIDRGISIAMSPTTDDRISLFSMDYSDYAKIDLKNFCKADEHWKEFIKGIAWVLAQQGFSLSGWQGVIVGNIPIGAGLSSSAAVEIALIRACMQAGNFSISAKEMAQMGRKAEQQWIGVNVGIMDQLVSAAGKKKYAVLLDCRSLDYEYIPIPESIQLVVLDTKTRRELAESAYNIRQEEVQTAARILEVPSLRDATMRMIAENQQKLPKTIMRRARHVTSENQRVIDFCKAMEQQDGFTMGKLINESHCSLRDDYEVSSTELNAIVEIAQDQPECYGARMTGAGFGGCALALINAKDCQHFEQAVFEEYLSATGLQSHIFPVSSSNGVQLTNP